MCMADFLFFLVVYIYMVTFSFGQYCLNFETSVEKQSQVDRTIFIFCDIAEAY